MRLARAMRGPARSPLAIARLALIALSIAGSARAVAASPAPPASPWALLATADVDRLHRSVLEMHPGLRDPDTPDFAARVEAAFATARARAARAASYADWLAATQGFVLSFRDGHTIFKPNLTPARARWPGFLIDGRAGGWFVRRSAEFPATDGPPEGARILACDGKPIAQLMETRLDGTEADWSKEPERLRQAFRLFLDPRIEGPPPLTSCDFESGGARKAVRLSWTIEPWAALSAGFPPFLRRAPHPIEVRTLASGARWIALGNFGDETGLGAAARMLEAGVGAARRAPFVVFDLRGNPGGNSTWGDTFAAILWGKAAADAKAAEIEARPGRRSGKYWRATPEVAAAARAAAAGFRARGRDFASVADYWTEVANRVATAPDGDRALVHDPCCDADPARPAPPPPPALYTGPAYVLIDAGCFSSCVLAANRLVEQGAVPVGETTGQNEEYGEVVDGPPLPSGLARYLLPVSIIRQPRETLRLIPRFTWPGAMDDDVGLERWIATLAARQSLRSKRP